MGKGWQPINDETTNSPFWICWHACMLYLHGVISYQAFEEIYNKYATLNN